MPKPTSKITLLEASQENYAKLFNYIGNLSEDQLVAEFREGTMNRNIRDVLGHLHFWHELMITWHMQGMKGIRPEMPAKGYTWKMTPQLNKHIWEKCQLLSYPEIFRLLQESYEKVQAIIKSHSDIELFEKKRYPWTGSTSLGAYLISNTSSHYHWALQLIKKQRRT